MKRWLTLPITGDGATGNHRRPDLKGVAVQGYVVAYYGATECLVKVVRHQVDLDNLKAKAGVGHHGDENEGTGINGVTVYLLPANVRAALVTEAERLGAGPDFRPEGYDVGG